MLQSVLDAQTTNYQNMLRVITSAVVGTMKEVLIPYNSLLMPAFLEITAILSLPSFAQKSRQKFKTVGNSCLI